MAAPRSFGRIADLILEQRDPVVVVVSAMANMTDQLFALAHEVNPDPPRREVDMLVTVGERISVALLAMALAAKGQEAVSFTGSQAGILTTDDHTEAKIVEVRPTRLLAPLAEGKVVLVAGFQGMSLNREITTLGRGGSDTTAVALGAALGAKRVEFYKDVDGIYTADPKHSEQATHCSRLSYDDALALCLEAKRPVLHPSCLELAKQHGLMLKILSFEHPSRGSEVVSKEALVHPVCVGGKQ